MNFDRVLLKEGLIVMVGLLCLALIVPAIAQVQTTTSTVPTGPSMKETTIESGEVVSVHGHDLFVKMSDGTLRHYPNVPASARANVDGQQLSVTQLQPGMKLQRTTITTTTPMVVRTVETVTGKVWHVTPPLSVILTLENGENQSFKIPDGQKFTVEGKEVDAFSLKKGMTVTATRVTETPLTSATEHAEVAGTMTGGPVLIAKGSPKGTPKGTQAPGAEGTTTTTTTTATTASNQLPKTASDLPLIGLLGLVSISASFATRLLRKWR
jgi:hypothetical protein